MEDKNSNGNVIITTKEIYQELLSLKELMLLTHEQVKTTNGKVKFHRQWLIGMTSALCVGLIACLVNIISNS